MPTLGTILGLGAADPIKAGLVVAVAVTGGMLAWKMAVTEPGLRSSLAKSKAETQTIVAEHERQVAAAEAQRAEQVERFRKLEEANAATVADLQAKVKGEQDARHAADVRADRARVMYVDAEARYVAQQAGRAADDPAAACRINGETIAMFRQLHAESDEFAGEASGAADDAAGKLARLQDYVRDVCLRRSAATP